MSEPNIYAFKAFIKDLKYKTHRLSKVVDELDMWIFSLRQLSAALRKACNDVNIKD